MTDILRRCYLEGYLHLYTQQADFHMTAKSSGALVDTSFHRGILFAPWTLLWREIPKQKQDTACTEVMPSASDGTSPCRTRSDAKCWIHFCSREWEQSKSEMPVLLTDPPPLHCVTYPSHSCSEQRMFSTEKSRQLREGEQGRWARAGSCSLYFGELND